jgi:rubrerythrin
MDNNRVSELLLNSLETEIGGVQIYETALRCVANEDLRKEWEKYRDQTERHTEILRNVCSQMGVDLKMETRAEEGCETSGNLWSRRWKWRGR